MKSKRIIVTAALALAAVGIITACLLTNYHRTPSENAPKLVDITLYEKVDKDSMHYDFTVTKDKTLFVKKTTELDDNNKYIISDSVMFSDKQYNYLKTLTEHTHGFLETDLWNNEYDPYYLISINDKSSVKCYFSESFGSGYDVILYYLMKASPIEILTTKGKPLTPYVPSELTDEYSYYKENADEYMKLLSDSVKKENCFNINYDYNSSTKTLTLSGKGRMEDYLYCNSWIETPTPLNIVVNEGITSICEEAFSADIDGNSDTPRNNTQYTERVSLPESVTKIGSYAFYQCRALKEINLPNKLKSLGEYAFSDCKHLKKTTIPKGVTKLKEWIFEGCISLEEVKLGDNITIIENCAFEGDEKLRKINLPKSLKEIEFGAFWDCEKLKKINIPDGVEIIGDHAFADTGLKSVSIPRSVKKIGDEAFGYSLSNDGYDKSFTIRGYKGTAAEKYAKKHGLRFEKI